MIRSDDSGQAPLTSTASPSPIRLEPRRATFPPLDNTADAHCYDHGLGDGDECSLDGTGAGVVWLCLWLLVGLVTVGGWWLEGDVDDLGSRVLFGLCVGGVGGFVGSGQLDVVGEGGQQAAGHRCLARTTLSSAQKTTIRAAR